MSGDVQPRKRKEKRRKKDSEEITSSFSGDEHIHIHKDASTGGNMCAKILFFLLSFVLMVMIGLVLFEYRGSGDDEVLVPISKWAPAFDGWLDEAPLKHEEHADVTESDEHEQAESGEHEDESTEGEDSLSQEVASKEEDEEGTEGGEEEEAKSNEELQEEEEEEDSEGNKSEDIENEEEDDYEREESEDQEEEDEEDEEHDDEDDDGGRSEDGERSEEDLYKHERSEEDVDEDEDDIEDVGSRSVDEEEEEEEAETAEVGGKEPDDDREGSEESAYGHSLDENDDGLNEIPGITESDEDDEGENLERSGETTGLEKNADVHEQESEADSEEEADIPRPKQGKQVTERTQPVEDPSTVTTGHKSSTSDEANVGQSHVIQDIVTEKPVLMKQKSPEKPIHSEEPSKAKLHLTSADFNTVKEASSSEPGETGSDQNHEYGTASTAALPTKHKDEIIPTVTPSRREPLEVKSPKLGRQAGAGEDSFKEKDTSSNELQPELKTHGVGGEVKDSSKVIHHSASEMKAKKVSDKSLKGVKQSAATQLDVNGKTTHSETLDAGKLHEEHKKSKESSQKHDTESQHATAVPVGKNNKRDKNVRAAADSVKMTDFQESGDTNTQSQQGATVSAPSRNKWTSVPTDANNDLEVNIQRAGNSGTKVTHSSLVKTQKVESSDTVPNEKKQPVLQKDKVKSLDKTQEYQSNKKKKIVNKQFIHKLNESKQSDQSDSQSTGTEPRLSERHTPLENSGEVKMHKDPKKLKAGVEMHKVKTMSEGEIDAEAYNDVPRNLNIRTEHDIKMDSDNNVKAINSETSADHNSNRKTRYTEGAPSVDESHSKSGGSKAYMTVSVPSKDQSATKMNDRLGSKTQEEKLSIKGVPIGKNEKQEKPLDVYRNEGHPPHQEKEDSSIPVKKEMKKPTESEKFTVTQSKHKGTSQKEQALPSQKESDSRMVK